jgi:hypothetical protein
MSARLKAKVKIVAHLNFEGNHVSQSSVHCMLTVHSGLKSVQHVAVHKLTEGQKDCGLT